MLSEGRAGRKAHSPVSVIQEADGYIAMAGIGKQDVLRKLRARGQCFPPVSGEKVAEAETAGCWRCSRIVACGKGQLMQRCVRA